MTSSSLAFVGSVCRLHELPGLPTCEASLGQPDPRCSRMTPTRRQSSCPKKVSLGSSTRCQTVRLSRACGNPRPARGLVRRPCTGSSPTRACAGSSSPTRAVDRHFAYARRARRLRVPARRRDRRRGRDGGPARRSRRDRAVRRLARRPLPARAGDARVRPRPARHRVVAATAALVVSTPPSLIVYVARVDHHDPRHDLPAGRVGADADARAHARGADSGERLLEHLRQPRRRSSARRSRRSCSRSADLGGRFAFIAATFAWSASFVCPCARSRASPPPDGGAQSGTKGFGAGLQRDRAPSRGCGS